MREALACERPWLVVELLSYTDITPYPPLARDRGSVGRAGTRQTLHPEAHRWSFRLDSIVAIVLRDRMGWCDYVFQPAEDANKTDALA
jgi:hypothetical protein